MNRRRLGIIALLVALSLFVAPLASPIPAQEIHLELEPSGSSTESIQYLDTTVRYQNLSDPAQQLFDESQDSMTQVSLDEAPEPWATLAPDNRTEPAYLQVAKNDRYYEILLTRVRPKPPLPAVVLRLGPLLASIGLGTFAGHCFLSDTDRE